MPNDLPMTIARTLSPESIEEAARWWRALTPEKQLELRRIPCAPRQVLVGRYVEPGDEPEFEHVDLYEYLVAHELFVEEKIFHICSAHPAARDAVASGRLSSDFRCPRGDRRCPMRAILDERPGCHVVVTARADVSGTSNGRCA